MPNYVRFLEDNDYLTLTNYEDGEIYGFGLVMDVPPAFSTAIRTDWLEKLNLEMDISDFSITPLKGKKVVTRTWSRLVDGSIGVYKITGNLELLNFLRAAGLGTRRSIGKGMWEVIY